jgi:hypothetical protein
VEGLLVVEGTCPLTRESTREMMKRRASERILSDKKIFKKGKGKGGFGF